MMNLFRLLDANSFGSQELRDNFVETEEYEAGFANHYQQHLKEKVVRFEEARLAALKNAQRNLLISIPLFLLVPACAFGLPFVIQFEDYPVPFAFMAIFLSWSGLWWFVTRSLKMYQQSIKTEIFPNILSFVGDFAYSPQTNQSAKQFEDSDIVPRFHRETSEDHIKGGYKGVEVELFETHLKRRKKTKKSTSYVTVFRGLFITLSMNKNFSGKTIVKRDAGKVGNWLQSSTQSLDKVRLEDPTFEKLFEVYSTDQIEARYLLTVTFMERLTELAGVFGGQSIECCFDRNHLLLKIPLKKNLFEPGSIFEPEDFIDDSKSLLKELNLIFGIVDILKLNMKINL